jgi:hypothetical protein
MESSSEHAKKGGGRNRPFIEGQPKLSYSISSMMTRSRGSTR